MAVFFPSRGVYGEDIEERWMACYAWNSPRQHPYIGDTKEHDECYHPDHRR